jgi:hypothetical protein
MKHNSQLFLLMAALPDLSNQKLGEPLKKHAIAALCLDYLSEEDLLLTENLTRRCAPWCSYVRRPSVIPEEKGLASDFIHFTAQLMESIDKEHPELAPEEVNPEEIREILNAIAAKQWMLAEQSQDNIRLNFLDRRSIRARGLEQLHLYLLKMLIYSRWEKIDQNHSETVWKDWVTTFSLTGEGIKVA